jgi:16S rRNA (cytosine967-C5)-methyltransferase
VQLEVKRALRKGGAGDSNDERAFFGRLVLGTTVLRRRLAFLAHSAGLEPRACVLAALYLVYQCDDAPAWRLSLDDPRLKQLLDDRLVAAVAQAAPDNVAWPTDPVQRLCESRSLPDWLAQLLEAQYGASEADSFMEACNLPGPITLRVNELRASVDAVAEALAAGHEVERGRYSPHALRLVDGRPPLGVWSLPGWSAGWYEIQDEGSQLIALATGAQPGHTVVDLCAGNGGKTLAMASLMGGRGRIIAYDVDQRRLTHLAASAARAGCAHCVSVCSTMDALLDAVAASPVDCVLVDAPCSSTGALRRTPHARWKPSWREETLGAPALQLQLLLEASSLVRSGGTLVYATCSVLAAENQDVARSFEAQSSCFTPLAFAGDVAWAGPPAQGGGTHEVALLPHVHGTDGFYIARWRRCVV